MELLFLFRAIILFLSSFTKHTIVPANESSVGTIVTHGIGDKKNHSDELPQPIVAALMPPMPTHDDNHLHTTSQYSSATVDIDNKNRQDIHEEITKFSDKSLSEQTSLGSTVSNLHRFETFCEDKIREVYSAIKEFNNFNYEKNQEIQYLSYNEKKQQEILKQSQEKKAQIELHYNKMHEICIKCERYRERITHSLSPYVETGFVYYPQPDPVPMLWYDIHNLETIVQQLFTPKLWTRTHFDEKTHQLKMHRGFEKQSERKRFLPLPVEYLNGDDIAQKSANSNIGYQRPETGVDVLGNKPSTIDHFNKNILEQYTYSLDKEIQQIIIYYVFKYYEHEVQDGTRKVFYFTQSLKRKILSCGGVEELKCMEEIKEIELRLSAALKELQQNTVEMERNRVIPELIGVYNAETEVQKLLRNMKYTTKLIGTHNKRVITVFNPSDSIQLNAMLLDTTSNSKTNLIDGKNINDDNALATISSSDASEERENLNEPLQWDQNWTWDF